MRPQIWTYKGWRHIILDLFFVLGHRNHTYWLVISRNFHDQKTKKDIEPWSQIFFICWSINRQKSKGMIYCNRYHFYLCPHSLVSRFINCTRRAQLLWFVTRRRLIILFSHILLLCYLREVIKSFWFSLSTTPMNRFFYWLFLLRFVEAFVS